MDKSLWSHAHGRTVAHVSPAEVDRARLFSYGYRSQTIGAFHATGVALRELASRYPEFRDATWLTQACTLLHQLESKAMDAIEKDPRALISTFHNYDRWIVLVLELLTKACAEIPLSELESIRQKFLERIEKVTSGDGIYIAQDTTLPEQGAFVVPDLDISIAPIIYGDNHSWNAAFLAGGRPGVSLHRHRQGAEIHLGYGALKGKTIVGSNFAEVSEGYAMPIPPMTDHGFLNTSGHDHVVPFIFGSLLLGGWGVFFDVEPRDQPALVEQPLESEAMNGSVFLDQAIAEMQQGSGCLRRVLIPAHRAGSRETGGLELAIARVGRAVIDPPGRSLPHPRHPIRASKDSHSRSGVRGRRTRSFRSS